MPVQAFLIDGTAYAYRAFYAVRSLSTADGRPTNAVYGFAVMLNALRKQEKPDYLAVAFDVGKPTFRHERYEAYKSTRKPMPDPLIAQLPLIKELAAAYAIPVFEREGYEAEDLLATVAKQIDRPDLEILFVTGDKDLLQLVGPRTKVYNPQKDDIILDEQAVKTRYGVPPARIVDLLALMGDQVDNIPGVPGIGEKTATALLKRFGTVDALYERLDEVESETLRRSLQEHKAQVELAKELAHIDDQAPITVTLDELAVREPDWKTLRRLFRQLEFKRLMAEVDRIDPADSASDIRARLVNDQATAEALNALLTTASPASVLCVSGDESHDAVLAVAWAADEAYIIPLSMTRPAWLEPLASWLVSDKPKIGHDLKSAMRILRQHGCDLKGLAGDTMIAAHLINPAAANRPLVDVAEEWLEIRLPPIPAGGLMAESMQAPVLARHACAVLPLSEALDRRVQETGLHALYRDLELPLIGVLADMETTGVAIDRDWLTTLRNRMTGKLAELTKELYRLAGSEFNLNSPKQLADVLFVKLKLPIIKRTKTGASTDSEVLQRLAGSHPLPEKLLEYRELSKLTSTYVDALPELIHPATGRLHTRFNQTGTVTGRLSSSEPNLQNIPIKTELGRQVRKAIVPGERGWSLVAADYSQVELRILGHLSQDEELMRAFREDRDVHRHTASLIYNVPERDVTSEMRSAAKTINFGIVYGMSAHGLSKELQIAHEEAAAFIQAYFDRYPGVRIYLDEQVTRARQDGYVQTLLGRRRYIPEVASPDLMIRQFGERMATNAPIQGTAADLIKLAMIRIAEAIRTQRLTSRMILQVHDELVFEVPPSEMPALIDLVRGTMERAVELSVPLRVTMKRGPNWLEMTECE